jgi:hypothetical protein
VKAVRFSLSLFRVHFQALISSKRLFSSINLSSFFCNNFINDSCKTIPIINKRITRR